MKRYYVYLKLEKMNVIKMYGNKYVCGGFKRASDLKLGVNFQGSSRPDSQIICVAQD